MFFLTHPPASSVRRGSPQAAFPPLFKKERGWVSEAHPGVS